MDSTALLPNFTDAQDSGYTFRCAYFGSDSATAIYQSNSNNMNYIYKTFNYLGGVWLVTARQSRTGDSYSCTSQSSTHYLYGPYGQPFPQVSTPHQVYFTVFAIFLCVLIAVLLWKTIGRLIGR